MSGYCITDTATSTNILHISKRHESFESVRGNRWMKYASTCLSSHEVHLPSNVCSCYAVPTSLYPFPPFPDKPKYPQEWIFMTSPPHSWSQVSVCLPFTRQIMGPQFIFLVKMAHTLGPYNTPQWSMTCNSDDSDFPMRGTERAVSTGDAPAMPSEDAHLTSCPQH